MQTLTARQHEQQWREQVAAAQVSLENQRVDLQDITSNMQRQYKVLGQDAMVAFITERCCETSPALHKRLVLYSQLSPSTSEDSVFGIFCKHRPHVASRVLVTPGMQDHMWMYAGNARAVVEAWGSH